MAHAWILLQKLIQSGVPLQIVNQDFERDTRAAEDGLANKDIQIFVMTPAICIHLIIQSLTA